MELRRFPRVEALESMFLAQQRKCHKTTRSQDQGPIFFLMVSLHAYRNGLFTDALLEVPEVSKSQHGELRALEEGN